MMNRRTFLCGLALGTLSATLAVEAQQPGKVYRIGILSGGLPQMNSPQIEAFRRGLRETGWIEGRDVVIEWRSAEGKTDRLDVLAAELTRLNVDVIVTAASTPATVAAKRATSTIPIIMIAVGSAVDTGLVASLARPGGNVTGSTTLGAEVATKRLQFVKDILPGAVRIALLWNPANPSNARLHMDLRQRAQQEHLQLLSVEVRAVKDFDDGFRRLTELRPDALLLTGDPMHLVHMQRVIEFAAKRRLPAIYNTRESAEAGGLMSYHADQLVLFRRAATYVDRILKGVKPADLPVEQPTKFDLAINLRTARALGITIPPTLLLQADQVIE
jgi:putative tryptophan/tyrosine transport system substrate-binding protein